MFKNIIKIGYLKNKGVRRLCFVLGVLAVVCVLCHVTCGLKNQFTYRSFDNIESVRKATEEGKVDTQTLVRIGQKYYTGMKPDVFAKIFLVANSPEYQVVNKIYLLCSTDKKFARKGKIDGFGDYDCDQITALKTRKIEVGHNNYTYPLNYLWALLAFYLPYLIGAVVKWIVMGFKENKKHI